MLKKSELFQKNVLPLIIEMIVDRNLGSLTFWGAGGGEIREEGEKNQQKRVNGL